MRSAGRGVAVFVGDGGLLMNLGCLVTAARFTVPLHILLIDSGLYELTGGQPVPNAVRTDFAALARGAGIGRAYACDSRGVGRRSPARDGPVFVWLKVRGEVRKPTPAADGRADRAASQRSRIGLTLSPPIG